MGNSQSVSAVNLRLSMALPTFTYELASESQHAALAAKPTAVFPGGVRDRTEFIDSLRMLLSGNGKINLGDKHFRMLYSRVQDGSESMSYNDDGTVQDTDQIFASIVASKHNGPVVAKIVALQAGRDKIEAFKMFKKSVEIQLHSLLDNIPDHTVAEERSSHSESISGQGPATIPVNPLSRQSIIDANQNHSQTTLASTVMPDEPPSYHEANK